MAYAVKADITGRASEYTIPSGVTDGELDTLISEKESEINRYTGNDFNNTSESFIFDGDGSNILQLGTQTNKKLISVSSIQYRSSYANADDFDDNGETLDVDSYKAHTYHIERVKSANDTSRSAATGLIWVKDTQNYKVTGNWGYSSVPSKIKRAVVLLVREELSPGYIIREGGRDLESEKWGNSYSYKRMPSAMQSFVKNYTGFKEVDEAIHMYKKRTPLLGIVDGSTRHLTITRSRRKLF